MQRAFALWRRSSLPVTRSRSPQPLVTVSWVRQTLGADMHETRTQVKAAGSMRALAREPERRAVRALTVRTEHRAERRGRVGHLAERRA